MFTLRSLTLCIICLSAASVLNGCGANHYSVHHKHGLGPDGSAVLAMDAKQRMLLSNVVEKTTEVKSTTSTGTTTSATTKKFRRFCAEPSPDVFSVLSQAASGSGSFGKNADPASISASLQAAFSTSETGATISRTQTINMLKEMMYRTCERYLNDEISEYEYPIIAARDQRIMTSILAIEQLTGVVNAKPVVIIAGGSASAGQGGGDIADSLGRAGKIVDQKKKAQETAQSEFTDIDKPEGSCQQLMAKKAEEVKTDEDKAKLKTCTEKKAAQDKAAAELKDARTIYDTLSAVSGKSGAATMPGDAHLADATAAETQNQIEQARLLAATSVANVVENIVAKSFRQDDETSFFCYRALDKNIPDVKESCINFISAKVDHESAQLENEAARLRSETQQTLKQETDAKTSNFKIFWTKVSDDQGNIDRDKLKSRIDGNFTGNLSKQLKIQLTKMKSATSKDELQSIFNTLPNWAVIKLMKD